MENGLMENRKLYNWIFFIRRFYHDVHRYPLCEYVLRGEAVMFATIDIRPLQEYEETFINELRRLKYELPNDKLQFLFIDIYNDLNYYIEAYFAWYESRKDEINSMNFQYEVYSGMYVSMKRTLKEVENINLRASEININSKPNLEFAPKKIEPIKWEKEKVLLAYLFNELKNKGFIEDKNIWKKLESVFVDKNGEAILNTTFPNLVSSYSKTKTTIGTKRVPKAHKEITAILDVLAHAINNSKT